MKLFNLNPRTAIMIPAVLALAGMPIQASETDNRIEASAKSSYNFKTYLKDDHIKVESTAGIVTLTGSVSEDYHKSLAQETVSDLPGVKGVNNQLTVAGVQPEEHSDAWITMKVKAVLAFHKNVSVTKTDVHTQAGVVTLSGSADSNAEKQLACEYAKDVEGVKEVRDSIVVAKPSTEAHRSMGEKVDDSSITAQVKTSLLFHKSTHAVATKVSTRDGVVTLRGEARNAAERDLVTKLTGDIEGVKHIHNRMTVQKA